MRLEGGFSGLGIGRGGSSYVPTGKEPTSTSSDAYWVLSMRVEDAFGEEPATIYDIYQRVTGPLGLSARDTQELVAKAASYGYLKQVRR